MESKYCDGCEREIELGGMARSTLYCRKCKGTHILCFECLFKPAVLGLIPSPDSCPVGGYWAECPIPVLVRGRAP